MGTKSVTVGLGKELKAVRNLRGLSRHAVAKPSKISAAYLQKLEEGVVRNPSPRILQRLAGSLEVSYGKLMELAGYAVPQSDSGRAVPQQNLLAAALRTEDLSAEETRAVAAFIAYLKDQRNPG